MPILETKGLTKYFGGLPAVKNLDLVVNKGEIVGLIGPNGAGKTTAFNVMSGYFKPTNGQIFFNGEEITGLKMDEIARKGLVRTFQHSILFAKMTVMENMIVALNMQKHIPLLADIFKTGSTRLKWQKIKEKARDILNDMGLLEVEDIMVGSLPYGYQRLLGVAVALAVEPTLILLDEPVTGMNHQETQDMVDKLEGFRKRGITTLLVEHHMKVVMGVCDRVYVMNFGEKMAEGLPEEVCKNANVIEAYLGGLNMHLEIKDISVSYGEVAALRNVSICIQNPSSIVALIGANGAGKTTVLKTVSGLLRPTSGKIVFEEQHISTKPPSEIVEMGITHIQEGRGLFNRMTVWENMMMGAYLCKSKQLIKENLERAYNYFPLLRDRSNQLAGSLSGGEQQMLAIGRALMSKPKLLLVDEPSTGLAPVLVDKTMEILEHICREEKVGILLVEQNASLALQMAETGYVLENGRIAMQGRGCDLLNDDKVRESYLGL